MDQKTRFREEETAVGEIRPSGMKLHGRKVFDFWKNELKLLIERKHR